MHQWTRQLLLVTLQCFAVAAIANAGFPVIDPTSLTRSDPVPGGLMVTPRPLAPLAAGRVTAGQVAAGQWTGPSAQVANPYVYSPRVVPSVPGTLGTGVSQVLQSSAAPAAEHLHQALRFESQNNVRMAIHAYHRALECDPTSRLALVSFGRLKHRIGDLDGAIVTYRQSLKHHPNDAIALNDLGLCYARSGDTKKALQCLTAASRLEPENKRYSNNLAVVLVEDKNIDQAILVLEEAHGAAIAHFNVAMMLDQCDHRTAACQHVREALKLDPSLTPARQLLANFEASQPQVAARVAALVNPTAENASSGMGEVAPEPPANVTVSASDSGSPTQVEKRIDARAERAHWNFLKERSSAMPLAR